MAYAKIDDGILDHPKCLMAGEEATNLFIRSIIWCNRHLTNGFIPHEACTTLTRTRNLNSRVAALLRVRLWERVEGGYRIVGFLDHNDSKEEVERKRELARIRQDNHRKRNASQDKEGNAPVTRDKRETSPSVTLPSPLLSSPIDPDPTGSVSPLPLSEGGMSESESASDPPAGSRPPPKRRPPPATTIRDLLDAWNEHAHPAMPRAVAEPKLSGPMERELRERPLDGETGWLALIDRMNASPWCRGEAQGSTRAMDVSFLLRHPADLLNGKYDDRRPGVQNIRTGYVHYGPDDGKKFEGLKGDVTHLL